MRARTRRRPLPPGAVMTPPYPPQLWMKQAMGGQLVHGPPGMGGGNSDAPSVKTDGSSFSAWFGAAGAKNLDDGKNR